MIHWINLIYAFLFLFPLQAKEETEGAKNKPPEIGNFALPTSQQPAALFGFGGNIIDEGELQMNLFADPFVASRRFAMDVIPGILYGIRDDFSLYLNFPYAAKFQDQTGRSSGIEDLYLQFEYAFYSKTNKQFTDQATVVANMTFPTGSIRKNPPTGFGSPAFFLGGTYYRTTVNWVFFTGQGVFMTSSTNKTKTGEIFYSQYGIGKNLKSRKGWIYAALFELDGQYANKNRVFGITNKNSGGTAIYLTPSLWVSSKEMIAQFGISLPLFQHWFGNQKKFDFALNFNFSWSFYKEKEGKGG